MCREHLCEAGDGVDRRRTGMDSHRAAAKVGSGDALLWATEGSRPRGWVGRTRGLPGVEDMGHVLERVGEERAVSGGGCEDMDVGAQLDDASPPSCASFSVRAVIGARRGRAGRGFSRGGGIASSRGGRQCSSGAVAGLLAAMHVLTMLACAAAGGAHTCTWNYNKLHWDLSSLVRSRPQRDYSVKRDAWTFYMNVCDNTVSRRQGEMCRSHAHRYLPSQSTIH